MADDHDDERVPVEIVDEIARAERVAAAAATENRDRPWCVALWAGCAVAVVGLLLPWSHDEGSALYTRDAFSRSGWPVLLGLLTVAGTVVLLAVYRSRPARAALTALRTVTGVGALAAALSTLAVAVGHQDNDPVGQGTTAAAGPWTFVLGLAALALLSHRLGRGGAPRRLPLVDGDTATSLDGLRAAVAQRLPARSGAPWPALSGALGGLGLALAAAGLFAPWERLHSSALAELGGSDTAVWNGTELPVTDALRWAVPATAVVAIGLLTLRAPLRRLVAPALLAGGVVIAALSAGRATAATLHGVNATLAHGSGPTLCLLGGIVCAAGGALGLAAGARPGRRAAAAAAVLAVTASVLAPAAAPHALAAGSTDGTAILGPGSDDGSRLGGPARDVRVHMVNDRTQLNSTYRPDVVATRTGTFFTVEPDDDSRSVLLDQLVGGRALPVTVLRDAEDVSLIDVAGDRALVLVRFDRYYAVVSADLHWDGNVVSALRLPGPVDSSGETATVLSTYPGAQHRAGYLPADSLSALRTPDGGVLLRDRGRQLAYRVTPAAVRGDNPWRPEPVPFADVPGPGSSGYRISADGVSAVSADGVDHPVLGGVSDPRCTLSRDPLSSALGGRLNTAGPPGVSVDAAGDLWFLLRRPSGARTYDVYVRSADGILRRLPGPVGRGAQVVAAMPDGSLMVQRGTGNDAGATLRIPDAAAAARRSPALGPVAKGCVSDNRVPVSSLGRRVHRLDLPALARYGPPDDPVPPQAVVVDARGTRVYATGSAATTVPSSVVFAPRDGRARVARRVPQDLRLGPVVADGRGGAWWDETPTSGLAQARLWHVDQHGRARMVREVRPGPFDAGDYVTTAADTGDGSLWWRWSDGRSWNRLTAGGSLRTLRYSGADPVVRDGQGYSVAADRESLRTVSADAAGGPVVLGGDDGALALPSAAASHASPRHILATGQVSVAPHDTVLLHQGHYLARVARDGRITFLATAASGLPEAPDRYSRPSEYVSGHTLVIYDGERTMWTVDVS